MEPNTPAAESPSSAPDRHRLVPWFVAAGAMVLVLVTLLLLTPIPNRRVALAAPENAVALANRHATEPPERVFALFRAAADAAPNNPDRQLEAANALAAVGRHDEARPYFERAARAAFWPHSAYPTLFSDRRRSRIAAATEAFGRVLVAEGHVPAGLALMANALDIVPQPSALGARTIEDLTTEPPTDPVARQRLDALRRKLDPAHSATGSFAELLAAFEEQRPVRSADAIALMEAHGFRRLVTADPLEAPAGRVSTADETALYGRLERARFRLEPERPTSAGEAVVLILGTRACGIGPLVEVIAGDGPSSDFLYIDSVEYRPYPLAVDLAAGSTEVSVVFLNDANENAFLTDDERALADRRLTDRNVLIANFWFRPQEAP
ncbi:MAG: hypothetical protein KF858_05500 [Candidatus Sumerlaeia bacterium]|nr:hypothetical protein [Candidatus Sumerlaeia bacterium]